MSKKRLIDQAALDITKHFTDQGKLVEAGWAAFAHFVLPKDCSADQTRDMQFAFMAGAEHTFSSIIAILDPGDEPTADDMRRMDLIHAELERWRGIISERVQPSQGRA